MCLATQPFYLCAWAHVPLCPGNEGPGKIGPSKPHSLTRTLLNTTGCPKKSVPQNWKKRSVFHLMLPPGNGTKPYFTNVSECGDLKVIRFGSFSWILVILVKKKSLGVNLQFIFWASWRQISIVKVIYLSVLHLQRWLNITKHILVGNQRLAASRLAISL